MDWVFIVFAAWTLALALLSWALREEHKKQRQIRSWEDFVHSLMNKEDK